MKGYLRVLAAAAVLGAALVFSAPGGAFGQSALCNGTLASGTYYRVVVPTGAVCLSDGPVVIRAGLFIRGGATFVLGSEDVPVSTGVISGGVHATNAANVD